MELQERNIKLVFAKKKILDEKEDLWSEALKIEKHCNIFGGVWTSCAHSYWCSYVFFVNGVYGVGILCLKQESPTKVRKFKTTSLE